MPRVRIAGLTLTTLFAFGAMSASAAQAAEYGRCLKAPKVHGVYTGQWNDNGCWKAHSANGHGRYEWYPGLSGPTPRPQYTAKTAATTLGEAAVGSMACAAGTDVGQITGPSTGQDTSTVTGCVGSLAGLGSASCSSPGEPSGTIQSPALRTELKNALGGEVWTKYEGYPYAEFECSGLAGAVAFGWVSGPIMPTNVMTKKFTASFTVLGGEQKLEFYYAYVGSGVLGPDPATLERTSSIKTAEKWEVKKENST